MAYIYENDVGRLGGNLQKTVGYLLSLHKAEYEWNLLGIKVVGHVDDLPIPSGNYEYGDAYTVGTAAPYDMWIYTRADEFHSEAYWFNIGKFPAPGPQGPKGDGFETLNEFNTGVAQKVTYGTNTGATIKSDAMLNYTNSTTGRPESQIFTMWTKLPIEPGKYISMDANSDNDALEVKVDDTALALDFIKLDKTTNSVVPEFYNGKIQWDVLTSTPAKGSIAKRDSNGDSSFHRVNAEYLGYSTNGDSLDFYTLFTNTKGSDYIIDKTPTDTGTLTATQIGVLTAQYQAKNLRIIYDNQVYIRMDPLSHPDGTINYIHIDSIQDGEGGYKATGKCFSVTVSTRAWQVVDLDFGRSYTHNIIIENGSTGDFVHFTLINHHPDSYAENSDGLRASIGDAKINCTVTDGARYYAGIIYQDGGYFHFEYGDSNHVQATTSQVTITDTVF